MGQCEAGAVRGRQGFAWFGPGEIGNGFARNRPAIHPIPLRLSLSTPQVML